MNGGHAKSAAHREYNNEPLILFVEGYSDVTFYAEVMEHLGFHERCFIHDLGGKGREKLRKRLIVLLKPDNLAKIDAVGVLLDADENFASAFNLARKALNDGLNVDVPEHGKWVTMPGMKTRFGIFIVSGPDEKGEIESVAWSAWSANPLNAEFRRCAEEFVQCANNCGRHLQSIDKVRIGAILSVLNEDDPRLGPGARANVFNFEAFEFRPLLEFLRSMGRNPEPIEQNR